EITQLIEQLKPNNTPVGDLIPSEIFKNNIDYWGPVFSVLCIFFLAITLISQKTGDQQSTNFQNPWNMSIIEKLEIYGLSNEAIQGQDTFRQKRSLKERIFLHRLST
ncbi:hypothetical protein L345_05931, partial [Ophiophagus hannah]